MLFSSVYFLLEGKEDFLADKYGEAVTRRFAEINGADEDAKTIISYFLDADPSKGKYLEWMVKQYILGNFRDEDTQTVGEDLARFEGFKNRMAKKDINQYKSLFDLREALEVLTNDVSSLMGDDGETIQALINKKELRIVHNTGHIRILEELTSNAATIIAKGTKWCTTSPSMFNSYTKTGSYIGSLYVVYIGKDKYQFHFESKQFMKPNDQQIQSGDIKEKDVKAIKQIFLKIYKMEQMPLWMMDEKDVLSIFVEDASKKNADKKKPISVELIGMLVNSKSKLLQQFYIQNEEYVLGLLANDNKYAREPNYVLNAVNTSLVAKRIIRYHISWSNNGMHNRFNIRSPNTDIFTQFIQTMTSESDELYRLSRDGFVSFFCSVFNIIIDLPIAVKQCVSDPNGYINKIALESIKRLQGTTNWDNIEQRYIWGSTKFKTWPHEWILAINGLEERIDAKKHVKSLGLRRKGEYLTNLLNPTTKDKVSAAQKRQAAVDNPLYIRYASRDVLTPEYIKEAIELNPKNLKYVPVDLVTDSMLYSYLKKTKISELAKLPKGMVTKEFTDKLWDMGYHNVVYYFREFYPKKELDLSDD